MWTSTIVLCCLLLALWNSKSMRLIPATVGQAGISGNDSGGIKGLYEYPGFMVDVTLSEKARKSLLNRKETLRAFGYYSGSPKPGALKKYISDEGDIGLGNFDVEFPVGGSGRIAKVMIKRDAFEQTDKKIPMLLVNVVSGRKSSKDNLLDCGISEDKLDKIPNGHIPISCKLIRE